MRKLKLVARELKNYFYLRKVLARESSGKGSSRWNSLALRKNWYGRVYTVVSLREEDMGEEEMVRNWRAMEMMRPINEYITSLDLQEIVFPSIEAIPDSRSYLVVYSPLFNEFTSSWAIRKGIMLLIIGAIAIVVSCMI